MAEAQNAFTASIAEVYDRHLGPVLFEPYARDLAHRIAHCPQGPVLETACGTGILTRQLRSHLHPSVRIVATDVNQGMIDYAQARLSTLEAIHWNCADATLLPFPSGSFAALACQFGMMFVRDKEAAFREARRVLADDGVLVFSVWDSLAHNPFSRIARETVSGFFAENPPDFFRVAFGFHDRQHLRRTLLAHGFDDLRVDRNAGSTQLIRGFARIRSSRGRPRKLHDSAARHRRGPGRGRGRRSSRASWWRSSFSLHHAGACRDGTEGSDRHSASPTGGSVQLK